jgi:hypothetical protein
VQIKLDAEFSEAKIIKRGQGAVKVGIKMEAGDAPMMLAQYEMRHAKLVKYKDTRLDAVQYTQSGSRGKLLITFAWSLESSAPAIRFHKVKNLKTVQNFDFRTVDNFDYKFADLIETTRITLADVPVQPQAK